MLVLSRMANQRVAIDLDGVRVWLTVVQLDGNKVRLGIDAPREVTITREELFARTDAAKPLADVK